MEKTVLVVEDEPFVLIFLEQQFEDCGFSVASARSGGEALHILGTGVLDIALLVTDIGIGEGIDGWEIARCAREIQPELPVLYITGDNAVAWHDQGVTGGNLLQKPFSRADLAEAISRLLPSSD